jgi:hypothetical protein
MSSRTELAALKNLFPKLTASLRLPQLCPKTAQELAENC